MAISSSQLEQYVIEPVLDHVGLSSEEATDLLLLTAAQESHMGTYLKQLGEGPALGIYQMEPATHDDIYTNYLNHRDFLRDLVIDLASTSNEVISDSGFDDTVLSPEMIGNLNYATAMARVHYLRVPEALPSKKDLSPKVYVEQLASYWKSYYNTPLGAGTVEEAILNYNKYVTS